MAKRRYLRDPDDITHLRHQIPTDGDSAVNRAARCEYDTDGHRTATTIRWSNGSQLTPVTDLGLCRVTCLRCACLPEPSR